MEIKGSIYDHLYNYKLVSWRVVDSDTLADVVLDFGMFRSESEVTIRLNFIDTPEKRRGRGVTELEVKAGKLTSKYVEKVLSEAKNVWVKSYRQKGKYPRLLCTVFADKLDLNEHLISEGFAYRYNGGTKKKFTKTKLNSIIKKLKYLQ